MTKDEALTLEALKYAVSKGYGRIVQEMKIAPFTIKYDEALAQPAQEPTLQEQLTEEQIWKCNRVLNENGEIVGVHICLDHQNVVDFARAIEREIGFSKAKLKEKNNGRR